MSDNLGALAAGLTGEVKGLREELNASENRRKKQGKRIWIVIAFMFLVLSGGGYLGHQINEESKERATQNCETLNKTNEATRLEFHEFIDLLAAANPPETPEEAAELEQQVVEFKADFDARHEANAPQIDCEAENN